MTNLKIKVEYLVVFAKPPDRVQGSQYVTQGEYPYGYLSVPGFINSYFHL